MQNEQTNKADTSRTPSNSEQTSNGEGTQKPLNIVDEARAIRDEIRKEREALKSENDRREKLQAEDMLAGTNGGNIPLKEPQAESPVDYMKKVMSGSGKYGEE